MEQASKKALRTSALDLAGAAGLEPATLGFGELGPYRKSPQTIQPTGAVIFYHGHPPDTPLLGRLSTSAIERNLPVLGQIGDV